MCWGSKYFKMLQNSGSWEVHFTSLIFWVIATSHVPAMRQHAPAAPAWYSRKNFTKMPIHLSTTYCQYICSKFSIPNPGRFHSKKDVEQSGLIQGVARNSNCSNVVSTGWKMIRRKHLIMITYDTLHPNQCEIQVSHTIHPASFCKK